MARGRNTRKSFCFSTCHFIYHAVTITTNYSFCFWSIFLLSHFFPLFQSSGECAFEIYIAVLPLAAFLYIYKYVQLKYEFCCFYFPPFFSLLFESYHHIAFTWFSTTGKKIRMLGVSNKGLKCGEASKHISSMLGKSNMKLNCKTTKQPKDRLLEHGRLVCVCFP